MAGDEFEKAFSQFLDSDVYDSMEEALFESARNAFTSGWMAALEYMAKKRANIDTILPFERK